MKSLQISLFGSASVVHTQQAVKSNLPRRLQALLAYLLLRQNSVSRELLMDRFWADHPPNQARSNLTTAIWRLRNVLEPDDIQPGTYLMTNHTGEISFNWESSYWLDTELFEKSIQPFLGKPTGDLGQEDISALENALNLYCGDLLEGLYDDWALRERERFRTLLLNCLERLMQFHSDNEDYDQSIVYAKKILRRDPLREQVHRNLMQLYLDSGQLTQAVQHYETFCEYLSRELGVVPLEETQALYQEMVDGSHFHVFDPDSADSEEIEGLLQELHSMKRDLSALTQRVERISRIAEHLARKR